MRKMYLSGGTFAAVLVMLAALHLSTSNASEDPVQVLASSFAAASDGAVKSALADQQVTSEEFAVALQATATCMESAGFDAEIDPGAGMRPGTVRLVAATDEEWRRGMPIHKACMAEHLDAVAIAWGYHLYQQRPAESLLDAARADCMRANGANVGLTFTAIQVRDLQVSGDDPDDLLGAYGACLRPLQEQYGAY